MLPHLRLRIDHPSLLFVQPLKSLCHTQRLYVEDASEGIPEQWLLQNRASLTDLRIFKAGSLPPSMRHMSALEKLFLKHSEKLLSLPDLPLSLRDLYIEPCHPDLENIRCRGSPEWYKISHVHRVIIGTSAFLFSSLHVFYCLFVHPISG